MLKTLLSLAFAVATLALAIPAFAQNDPACADQPSASSVANVTMTQTSCNSDYDCGYGNICEYGQCRPAQCWTSNQCFPWEKCDEGRCVRDPWATHCDQDKQCLAGYYCWAGYCKHY